MNFSAQAMVDAWIDVSIDRLARVRHSPRSSEARRAVRIDAVRADSRAPVVTIINWRLQGAPGVGRFAAQSAAARAAAGDRIGSHDASHDAGGRITTGRHDLVAPRQGTAAL